jgi:hypothetical protein
MKRLKKILAVVGIVVLVLVLLAQLLPGNFRVERSVVTAAVMVEVFVLNMTYDIGLKQVSLHLLLMAGFLLAPCAPRFADFFVRNRAATPYAEPPLFAAARANRAVSALQLILIVCFLGMYGYISRSWWYADGGGTPRSPLYGIWNIEAMSVDGAVRPPVLNDYDRRWRRVVFDAPGYVIFQRTDDSFARYRVKLDTATQEMTLAKGNSAVWRAAFQFSRPADDRLVIDGSMDGLRIHLELAKVGMDTFRLLNSNFRWVRPPDPATVAE